MTSTITDVEGAKIAAWKQIHEQSGVVTVHDGEGSTYKVKEITHKGKKYTHDPVFPNTEKMLASLPNYVPRSDDVWLLTFPRSGTHWTYEILGILLSGKAENIPKFKQSSMLEIAPDIADFESIPSPRILDTHLYPELLPDSVFEKTRVVVVVRNPKALAVSAYYMIRGMVTMEYSGTFSGFLPDFYAGKSVFSMCGGSWFDYYCGLWEKHRDNPNVMFVFYEDLKKDPLPVLQQLSTFLGLDRSKEFCAKVVELTSFDKMKVGTGKDEREKEIMEVMEKSFMTTPLFRKGQIADWKNVFTVAQNEAFDEEYKEKMAKYPDLAKRIQFL